MKTPKTVYALFKQGEKRWIKYWLARTAWRGGRYVNVKSDKATCFCLLGAMIRVYGYGRRLEEADWKIRKVIGMEITYWNDARERTFKEVLAAVRKAGI